jgi:hypothetical protein
MILGIPKSEERPFVKIYIAILCGTERTGWLCPSLVDWILAGKVPAGVEAEISLVTGYWPVDHARNICVARATQNRADWLLMIDNDNVPDPQTLNAIAMADRRGHSVVGFACPFWGDFGIYPSAFGGDVPNPMHDEFFEEILECGSPCLAIRMTVFEKLVHPYFRLSLDKNMEDLGVGALGEDIRFCRAARAAGFRIHLARGISVDHFKTVSLLKMFEKQRPGEKIFESPRLKVL